MAECSESRTTQRAPDGRALKLGGAMALVGGLGYFVTLLLHGDLPDETTEVALAHIAGRPEWRILKLALMASVMCWIGAFVALARSLPDDASGLLGRWAVGSAIVGVAIVVVEYAIIGHALKEVSLAWQAGVDRTDNLRMATVMLAISGGLFHSFVAWMLGLPYLLLGTAVALAGGDYYPRWLGWIAMITGAGALLAGTTRFLGVGVVPYPVLYGGFVLPSTLWLAAMGVLMWRRARMAPRSPAQAATTRTARRSNGVDTPQPVRS